MTEAMQSLAIVIRAWHEGDEIRVRLIYGDVTAPRTQVCRSVDELVDLIRSIFANWQPDSGEDYAGKGGI